MKYCVFCGAPMEEKDDYCSHCGNKIKAKEPTNKLCCELAYSGCLFWLPLLVCPKDKYSRFCSNQGLWVLILSVTACTIIRILGRIDGLLAGELLGVFSGAAYSLMFIVFLGFMFYLFWQCLMGALAIHHDKKPDSILFFEDMKLIK